MPGETTCGSTIVMWSVFLGGALAISQRLRDISAELMLRGYVNERGRPFSAASIAAMLAAGLLKPTRMLA